MSCVEFLLPLLVITLLFIDGEAASIPRKSTGETCGYQTCPKVESNKLNIHLIAHTHDDVGWLKTVDQYYFGSRTKIQAAGVQYIIDSVVQSLLRHSDRRFIYVETSYLWKWWLRQDEKTQEDVRMLINEGRLEIIGGGWSMNDEAVTHYQSLVDQYTWGFRRLNDIFGYCARPKIGWQIDPFGHSREQASLFAQLGFDGMFLGRLDYQDKQRRLKDKTMEMIWQGSPNLGPKANLFTVALYNTYSPPSGFCFDVLCGDEPIIDDIDSPDYNVKDRVHAFLTFARYQATFYKTNNIIITMGNDFNYEYAEMWFINLDKLIRYIREYHGDEINIMYSTPSCYLKALNDAQLQWLTKSDDFFPYASDPHSYWTGYFTSRAALKFYERMGNNILQISKQLAVLADLNDSEELIRFREAMGIMQHHDAVTGTEKQHVAEDYARILYKNIEQGIKIASEGLRKWEKRSSNSEFPTWVPKMYTCMQLNISSCPYTEQDHFLLRIYNPVGREVQTPIRLPVLNGIFIVQETENAGLVTSQLVPIPNSVKDVPERTGASTQELVFLATIPAMGYKFYTISKTFSNNPDQPTSSSISNEFYDVSVNNNGEVNVKGKNQQNMNVVQSFNYYEGVAGDNKKFDNRSSGAYIFRPKSASTKSFGRPESYKIYTGPVVQEIHQVINSWISQVIRLYKGKEYVEFDWLVGPIPVSDGVGKEIVTKYSSNLNSRSEFYTDSNGREMLKRRRNYRPTWNLNLEEHVSGNYYPVTTKISLVDNEQSLRLSALTDRAQGGTSMNDGELELMLHRRLLRDDAFGVGEALNEMAFGKGLVVRGTHYLIGGTTQSDEIIAKEKYLAMELALRPLIYISSSTNMQNSYDFDSPITTQSGLKNPLPPNIHILTLEPWKDDTILLRLEHLFEVGESATLSQPVAFFIQDLFSPFKILSVEDTMLGANQLVKDSHRMYWKPETNSVPQYEAINTSHVKIGDHIKVTINPMEIKTYIIKVASRT